MSLRVTLDTNVYISGLLFQGVPKRLMELAIDREFNLLTSPYILWELEEKIRVKFRRPQEDISSLMSLVRTTAEIVLPTVSIAVCRDPADNHILQCALTGQADYIITGAIKIFSPSTPSSKSRS